MKRFVPLLLLAFALLYLGSTLRTPRTAGDFDFEAFGRLPVLKNGRIKPLDTVARTSLLQLQGRQTVRTPEGTNLQPIEWLARLLFAPAQVDGLQTFEVTHPEVLSLLGLEPEAGAGKKRFSFAQIGPKVTEIERQVQLSREIEAKNQTAFQRATVQLYNNVTLYQQLKYSLQDPDDPDFLGSLIAFQAALPAGIQAVRAQATGQPHDEAAARKLMDQAARFQFMDDFGILLSVPPRTGAADAFAWKKTGGALIDTFRSGEVDPAAMVWAGLGHTFRAGRATEFNKVVHDYREILAAHYTTQLRKSDLETRFNAAAPFYTSMVLYVFAFILAALSWLRWPQTLGRGALYLIALAFLATTAGILVRMWLEGRPPVTNLYSSAVFIGWGSVALCLALEYFYRNGIGSATAGLIGFCTLLIAHHLSLTGDTLEMMRAVLDSNFWLATHVIVVTIGYSATFVAGALAIVYVVLGFFTRLLTKPLARSLAGMVYGIVCFATLFSLVGTILGGIWADQSWGRFWGWDPKENGALMIVLWNALVLHARWGSLVKQTGLMNLAIVGNVITAWSWFGTNLLGVGLHSYGFTESGAIALWCFVASQLALIALSLRPSAKWRSAQA